MSAPVRVDRCRDEGLELFKGPGDARGTRFTIMVDGFPRVLLC